MENEENELAPFTVDTPDIGSIVLEEPNLEGEKVTIAGNNNTLMSNILYEIKSFRKFQEIVESKLSLMENVIVNSKPYSIFENTNNSSSRFIENVYIIF